MLPASNRGAGMNIGFPDPCLTPMPPPVPPIMIPYPNFGAHAVAMPFSFNVLVTGMNGLSVATKILVTAGDEPGVANVFFKQAGAFTAGSPVVHLNNLPGISLLCPTTGNNFNNAVGAVLVPSVVNVLYSHAAGGPPGPAGADPPPRDLALADVDALAEALASVGRREGPPVTCQMRSHGVGEVAIRVFSADVPARMLGAIRALEAQGMRELVIDLCDNPGGEMNAAVELAGDFLEPGSEVVTVVDEDGDETVRWSWQETPYRFPVTILVNRGTASAAELFAGCLAAHGRAAVVGGETYGKHVAQRAEIGPDGAARMETVVRYRLPRPEGRCA